MMEELALNIMDIIQNSLAAGASRVEVEIEEDHSRDLLVIRVRDNGRGMAPHEARSAQDPFYTTKRAGKVGLGIPLFKEAAEHCGGFFSMLSEPGKGTTIEAGFRLSHIDRPPLGEVADTLLVLMVANPRVDFQVRYRGDGEFRIDTREVKEMLGDMPLTTPEVLRFLKEYVEKGLNEVRRAI